MVLNTQDDLTSAQRAEIFDRVRRVESRRGKEISGLDGLSNQVKSSNLRPDLILYFMYSTSTPVLKYFRLILCGTSTNSSTVMWAQKATWLSWY
jgi:hypothetical protein